MMQLILSEKGLFFKGPYAIVEDKVILELKAVKEIHPKHEAQLVNYLKATGIEIGLLINFGESVVVKRKILDQR
jgi:GxxExxY protein